MKVFLIVFLALLNYHSLHAQNLTTITINTGGRISDVLTAADIFYYPQFTKGKVFFRDGNTASAKMNYNLLVDEMHFIDPKGDTLSMTDEKTLAFISLHTDTFYYDRGYVRFVGGNKKVKLAQKKVWEVVDTKRNSGYNSTSSTSSTNSYTAYNMNGRTYDLVVNEEIVLRKVELNYLGDSNNNFLAAGKKNLFMLFPKEQRRIEKYLKENKVDFTSRKDLERMILFLEYTL